MPSTRGKKLLQQYEDAVKSALKDINQGMSITRAAKKWDVPKSSLSNKINHAPSVNKVGPHSILSKAEENIIVEWVVYCCDAGFSVTEDQVLNSIQYLITELKKETPFPYNRPSKKWFYSFLQRNKDVAQRVYKKINDTSGLLSKEQIELWFKEVSTHLYNINLLDVLNDPERVFNADEFGFFINPKDNKSLFKRGAQRIYKIINIDQKECLIVFLTVSASGRILPPNIILQHSRSINFLQKTVPDGWGFGISENGWMTGKTFYEYVANVLNPWLDANHISKPVILFFNSRTTHLTLQLSRFCSSNGIILIGVLPNGTYTVQPLDVAVFPVLREQWLVEANRIREESKAAILKVSEFCSTLEQVLENTITPSLIQYGFQRCGLLPWNPLSVDYENLTKDFEMIEQWMESGVITVSVEENVSVDPRYKTVLKMLEREMGEERVRTFSSVKNEPNWTELIDKKDSSLFQVWKGIASKADKVQVSDDWIPEQYCEVVFQEMSEGS